MPDQTTTITAIIAAVSALLGAVVPVIGKTVLDFFTTTKKVSNDEIQQRLEDLRIERADVQSRAKAITDDLQKQIFDMRSQLIVLHQENLKYIQENAELKARVSFLTAENIELKARLVEVESSVKTLNIVQSENDALKSHVSMLDTEIRRLNGFQVSN